MGVSFRLLAAPFAAAALWAAAPSDAQADCFYMQGSPNVEFPRTPITGMTSMTAGEEILGTNIPTRGEIRPEAASALGEMMNFACLYRSDINRVYPEQPFAPGNIRDISLARALVGSMSDKEYPVRFNFRSKRGEYMSADINCDNITINFDPQTYLNAHSAEDQRSSIFMGSVISLLSSAYRNRPNYVGHYEIGPDYMARPGFRPDRTNTCAAQIS